MEFELRKSKRKTIAVEITRNKEIIVKVPLGCSRATAEKFVNANEDWILRTFVKIDKRLENAAKYDIPDNEKEKYILLAKKVLPEKTEYWSRIMGLKPSYVKITSAKTRFGSCNSKNGICYSYRLMAYPENAIDYVVVHELAHIVHKNHGKDFYKLIESVMPDYRERERILRHKE